jgi:hypothetical protein
MSAAWYPACIVNLRLRFDESLTLDLDSQTPDPIEAQLAEPMPVRSTAQPTPAFLAQGSDGVSWIRNRTPTKAKVELNGLRTASTFQLTFDYRDFPLDPRLLRAVGVEIHLGTVRARAFGEGAGSNQEWPAESQLQTRNAAGEPNLETQVLVGMVDESTLEFDDDRGTVTMEGRDLRGILIDKPLNVCLLNDLDVTQPIDVVVRTIISWHPFGQQFLVVAYQNDWPDYIIPSPMADGVSRSRQGARRGARAAGRRTRGRRLRPTGNTTQLTFWDAITQYCQIVGAIPSFVGTTLYIRPIRTVFSQAAVAFAGDAFYASPFLDGRPRIDANGRPFSIRRLVIGEHTRKFHFKRKQAGVKPKAIELIATDVDARGVGRIVTVRHPPAPPNPRARRNRQACVNTNTSGAATSRGNARARTTDVSPSGRQSQEDVRRVPWPFGADEARMRLVAYAMFEEQARGETEGSIGSKTLASFSNEAHEYDPDLLRLRAGDAIQVVHDLRAPNGARARAHAFVNDRRRPLAELIAEIRGNLGGDENLARAIALTTRNMVTELSSTFRTTQVTYTWGMKEGIEVEANFVTYIERRYSAEQEAAVRANIATEARERRARALARQAGTARAPTSRTATATPGPATPPPRRTP